MKKLLAILVGFLLLSHFSFGQLAGTIRLKEDGEFKSDSGQIFVGKISCEPEDEFSHFPSYLKGMINSVKSQNMSSINKDGSFGVESIPLEETVVIGISFPGVVYFFESVFTGDEELQFNKVIDLDENAKDISIEVIDKTELDFKSEFAAVSYLIRNGSEGRVFTGKKKEDGRVSFSNVPFGSYSFCILSEIEGQKANRVDLLPIEVEEEEEGEEQEALVFEVK